MNGPLSYADIEQEFEESLGYIRNDIAELLRRNVGLNYTVALLIGCACEALAASDGRHHHDVFADLLDGEWRSLAKPLFNALRNGLAHSFDTKHLHVEGEAIQIHISWTLTEMFVIEKCDGAPRLVLGIQPLANRLCKKVNEFKAMLQNHAPARQRFRQACQKERIAQFSLSEADVWKRLVASSKHQC